MRSSLSIRRVLLPLAILVAAGLSAAEDEVEWVEAEGEQPEADSVVSVELDVTNACPIAFFNRLGLGSDAVPEGVYHIRPEQIAEGLEEADAASVDFRCVRSSDASIIPLVVAIDGTESEVVPDLPTSLAGAEVLSSESFSRVNLLRVQHNVLPVMAAGYDLVPDRPDRFMANPVACTLYAAGGAEEARELAALVVEAIRRLPEDVRALSGVVMPWLLRYGQKGVVRPQDMMQGVFNRPAIQVGSLDREKVLKLAEGIELYSDVVLPPVLDINESGCLTDFEPIIDLFDSPYTTPLVSYSGGHFAYIARGGNRTLRFRMTPKHISDRQGRLVWRVLQGDPSKIRIRQKKSGKATIEIDWHEPFAAPLADGRTVRTSRVDIGFFRVNLIGVSCPSVLSVYFPPNERRTFDEDGRLKSIDYTQRQYEDWCPSCCAKGDWKDVFHRDETGALTGWTRTIDYGDGRVRTNEFTSEGLVVDSRDSRGRPVEAHWSLRASWLQGVEADALVERDFRSFLAEESQRFDAAIDPPEEATLARIYVYDDDNDGAAEVKVKPARPYARRPELCRRADLADPATGFPLPLADQLWFGFKRYTGYKHDLVNPPVEDLAREDSPVRLRRSGLNPPAVPEKMKLCPWKPADDDGWRIETEAIERDLAASLLEQSDGAYRLRDPDAEDDEESWLSVSLTLAWCNVRAEEAAARLLDESYPRCTKEEVCALMADRMDEALFDSIRVLGKGEAIEPELQEEVSVILSVWKISDELRFGIRNDLREPGMPHRYFLRRIDPLTGAALSYDDFLGLPSRRIGSTLLRAQAGDPAALNDCAVFKYAELMNPDCYEESAVRELLERAARLGNATARENLEILQRNRGESPPR